MTQGSLSRYAVMLGLMLPVGFALGTLVLLGPVRWITSLLRNNGAPAIVESLSVISIILALVLVTAAIGWALSGAIIQGRSAARIVIPLLAIAAAGAAWSLWMNTSLVASLGASGEELELTPGFTFGPYPEESDLRRLKEQGFTGVISLLHPAVVPFEPQLLERERETTKKVGIPFIHLPMLPWISSNDESLTRLAELAKEGEGRYYVHCYLGRDRVRLAQRVIEDNLVGSTQIDTSGMGEQTMILRDGHSLERGVVQFLNENVVAGPYPTPEEFSTYIVAGGFDHVVSLMAPVDSDAQRRIDEERIYLSPFSLSFSSIPDVQEAIEHVKGLEGRVYVHGFFSIDSDRAPALRAFVEGFSEASSAPVAPASR